MNNKMKLNTPSSCGHWERRIYLLVLYLVMIGSAQMQCASFAAELLHVYGDRETFSMHQLQQSCQLIAMGVDAHWCNPANLSQNSQRMAQAEIGVRADEEGLNAAKKTASRKPSKSDVENLFNQKNFSAVSGYGRVETIADKISVSYTPVHFVAAYRVNNPALPEISLFSMQQSIVRVDAGSRVGSTEVLNHQFTLDLGLSAYWFERSFYRVDDQLINISINQDGQIGTRNEDSGFDTDLGLLLRNDHFWFPDLAWRVDRMARPSRDRYNTEKIQIKRLISRTGFLSAGKMFKLHLGQLGVESSVLMQDGYGKIDVYRASVGLQYGLGGLMAFISASPMMESFGFAFQGPFYLAGIQYSNEKQANELQVKRQRMTYVYTKIQI